MALAASVLGLALLGGGGAFWFLQERQARLAGVEANLARIWQGLKRSGIRPQPTGPTRLAGGRRSRRLTRPLLDRRPGHVAARPTPGRSPRRIADELAQAERDRTLREELASLRTSVRRDCWDTKNAAGMMDRRFARAFKSYGLDLEATPIRDAVARLKYRPETFVLEVVGSLDHWLSIRHDLPSPAEVEPKLLDLRKILELAQGLDSDPERNRLRALLEQADLKTQLQTLGAMTRKIKLVEFGPSTALLFARLLNSAGDTKNAIAVLRAAVVRYPADPWTNFELATLLNNARPRQADEAIRFYTAARAVRPETGWDLAQVLHARGRDDEVEAIYREFVRLDPERTRYLHDLFRFLQERGKKDEARAVAEHMIASFRGRLGHGPADALTHRRIAFVLLFLSADIPGAVAAYREAARVNPKDAASRRQLGMLLLLQGDRPGAIAAYREAIRIDPMRVADHYSLAAALELTGDPVGEIAELREAVRLGRLLQDPASGVTTARTDATFDDSYLDTISPMLSDMLIQMRVYRYSYGRVLGLTGDHRAPSPPIAKRSNSTPDRRLKLGTAWEWRLPSRAICRCDAIPQAFREAIQHEHLQQVGLFRLLQAILTAERPNKAIAALRRVREQARDDGTIGRAIDLVISQFEQLSKLDQRIPR